MSRAGILVRSVCACVPRALPVHWQGFMTRALNAGCHSPGSQYAIPGGFGVLMWMCQNLCLPLPVCRHVIYKCARASSYRGLAVQSGEPELMHLLKVDYIRA